MKINNFENNQLTNQRTPRRRRRIQSSKSFYSIWLLPAITRWTLSRQYSGWKAAKCLKIYTPHKKRTFDGQKIPSWLREHREGGKVEDKGRGGVDKWRQRDLMRAAGAFIFMRTNRRTWSRLSATESDQLGSFLSATLSLWPETNPICFYNSTWIIARFLLSLFFSPFIGILFSLEGIGKKTRFKCHQVNSCTKRIDWKIMKRKYKFWK